jgi:hypothetical protein
MIIKNLIYLLLFSLLALNGGCSGDEDESASAVFNPHEIERGTFVGDLTVTEVEHYDTEAADWSGIVTFHGELEISGRYGEHPVFPDIGSVCFFPDDRSVRMLPRYSGDKRDGWFSFSNEDDDPLLAPLRNPKIR